LATTQKNIRTTKDFIMNLLICPVI